jgi:hypothetical protein
VRAALAEAAVAVAVGAVVVAGVADAGDGVGGKVGMVVGVSGNVVGLADATIAGVRAGVLVASFAVGDTATVGGVTAVGDGATVEPMAAARGVGVVAAVGNSVDGAAVGEAQPTTNNVRPRIRRGHNQRRCTWLPLPANQLGKSTEDRVGSHTFRTEPTHDSYAVGYNCSFARAARIHARAQATPREYSTGRARRQGRAIP